MSEEKSYSIRRVTLHPKSTVSFQHNGGGVERVSLIDLTSDFNYKVTPQQHGLFVERANFVPKLIPWHLISDMDCAVTPAEPAEKTPVASAPTVITKK